MDGTAEGAAPTWKEVGPRLMRSRDRVFGGVCGGFAKYSGMDPTLVRVLFVLIAIVSGGVLALIVYLVAWGVLPEEP